MSAIDGKHTVHTPHIPSHVVYGKFEERRPVFQFAETSIPQQLNASFTIQARPNFSLLPRVPPECLVRPSTAAQSCFATPQIITTIASTAPSPSSSPPPIVSTVYLRTSKERFEDSNRTAVQLEDLWRSKIQRLQTAWDQYRRRLNINNANIHPEFASPFHQVAWANYHRFLNIKRATGKYMDMIMPRECDPRNVLKAALLCQPLVKGIRNTF